MVSYDAPTHPEPLHARDWVGGAGRSNGGQKRGLELGALHHTGILGGESQSRLDELDIVVAVGGVKRSSSSLGIPFQVYTVHVDVGPPVTIGSMAEGRYIVAMLQIVEVQVETSKLRIDPP